MKRTTFLATVVAASLAGSGAMAALVSIDQIDAQWQNAVPNSINGNIDNSGPVKTIRWGGGANPSGYDFAPRSPLGFTLAPDTATRLGTFTHLNFPISGTSLTDVELNFSFGGSVIEDAFGNPVPSGALTASFGAIFTFDHNETPNSDPNPNDFVTVGAVGGLSEVVDVGVQRFTFTLLGFSDDGVNFSNVFETEENASNSRDLWFDYSVSVVPLPAAGWLLLAGVGALGAAGRRRRKAA